MTCKTKFKMVELKTEIVLCSLTAARFIEGSGSAVDRTARVVVGKRFFRCPHLVDKKFTLTNVNNSFLRTVSRNFKRHVPKQGHWFKSKLCLIDL
jgi:hypothetical protein